MVKTIELPVEKTPVKEPEPIGGDGPEFCGPHIRCPLCRWRPRKTDRWMCKCRHIWNTFDTGGVCPSCLFQWLQTQCLACKKFSPHSDWYETE